MHLQESGYTEKPAQFIIPYRVDLSVDEKFVNFESWQKAFCQKDSSTLTGLSDSLARQTRRKTLKLYL